jgi:CRISPR-associated protein Csh2
MRMIKNRSEIVFLYDIKDINPNGDPMDENKPRLDEETGTNLVTDVRLKRTIRDHLHKFLKEEIFVREIEYEPGKIQDAKLRAEDFLREKDTKLDKSKLKLNKIVATITKNVLESCIDVRLFGATIPIEKSKEEKTAITMTGPVQFRMGRSLHKVEVIHIKGTGAFASELGKEQKTFRDEYILPYSLISFYGIVNENASKTTGLTDDDVELLLDGMWNGTKNLISRSKIGQVPRLLLRVVYKEQNFHIGDLDKLITLIPKKSDEQIRDISDLKLDVTKLLKTLSENRDKIEKIEFEINSDVQLISNKEEIDRKELERLLAKEFQTVALELDRRLGAN